MSRNEYEVRRLTTIIKHMEPARAFNDGRLMIAVDMYYRIDN